MHVFFFFFFFFFFCFFFFVCFFFDFNFVCNVISDIQNTVSNISTKIVALQFLYNLSSDIRNKI